jgi:hypothetical protein
MYGGVPTQEIIQIIAEIETELQSSDYRDYYGCGVRDGLKITLKKLIPTIHNEDYCKEYFERIGIE